MRHEGGGLGADEPAALSARRSTMDPLRVYQHSNSGRLRIPSDAAHLIRGIHHELKRKIRGALEIIIATPDSGKALKDESSGLRSFRVGKFRVVYRTSHRMIEIVAVGPRSKVYEETLRLIHTKSD